MSEPLILATRNAHKLREFNRLLAAAALTVRPLPDEVELPPEDGATFADNALPKARAAAAATGRVAIADDSGIEAQALGGRPGVRSARYAGEGATDEDNLAKLLARAPAGSGLRYVCALAYVDPAAGIEQVFIGECRGRLAAQPAWRRRVRLRPRLPAGLRSRRAHDGRALGCREGRDQPPRRRCRGTDRLARGAAMKTRTAALSVVSNSLLILLKVIAGTVTGSVAILTEAVHSSIDLVASIVAFLSVRKADIPADERHRYGHEKIENLAAAIEGMLILVGSAAIAFEAIRHLIQHGQVHTVGIGIAVVAVSLATNVIVSARLARAARQTGSAALAGDAAHLGTDALTSAAVLVALVLVAITGAQWIDPVVALIVAVVVVRTGVGLLAQASRVLVDEALPPDEMDSIRSAVEEFSPQGVVGYHELRTRRAGSTRYVDLHLQFRAGTSLEEAHRTAHELQDLIGVRLGGADVLIHLEPEDRVRPGEVLFAGREAHASGESVQPPF